MEVQQVVTATKNQAGWHREITKFLSDKDRQKVRETDSQADRDSDSRNMAGGEKKSN